MWIVVKSRGRDTNRTTVCGAVLFTAADNGDTVVDVELPGAVSLVESVVGLPVGGPTIVHDGATIIAIEN